MFFTISFPLFGTQLRFDLIDHFDPIIAIYSPQITLFKDKSSLPCKILCSVLLSGLQQIIIDPTEIPRNTCSFIVNKNILLCLLACRSSKLLQLVLPVSPPLNLLRPISSVCTLHPPSTGASLPDLGCASAPVCCLPLPLLGTQTVSYSACLPLPLTSLSTLLAE